METLMSYTVVWRCNGHIKYGVSLSEMEDQPNSDPFIGSLESLVFIVGLEHDCVELFEQIRNVNMVFFILCLSCRTW